MNKFKFYFILTITTLSLFSCSKSDTVADVPLREYATQHETDKTDIEEYLKTYYITVTDHAGFTDDQDVTFTKIPTGGLQPTIYSFLDSATYPKLLSKEVSLHDIKYKLYYLVLREGVGASPCNVDGVLAAYKGDYLARKTVETVTTLSATTFETVKYPQQFLSLFTTITGWGEGFPLFKTGTTSSNTDGTVSFNNFGAGVLFIPSGLAYYNNGAGSIPSYSPLVFSFKLYEIQRLDQDQDGIPSYQEDNGDGFLRVLATGVTNPDDTDKDGIPDFIDIDDDADNFTTKLELKKPDGTYHTFGTVPSCSGQTVKRYLTASCKPPYIN
ncbi:FKBP-type peptidylprolyl isomerase [Flavobacterium sp.]|uniref:FKBP-type peptidyl-prolyl cis-trans isomerase n=1 Tax=Flavobacterium sp. TaxID=239 RepID=UPI00286CC1B1|nr:FKBP-type peptidylprolyl isomerase [Flavobacterium sp.]